MLIYQKYCMCKQFLTLSISCSMYILYNDDSTIKLEKEEKTNTKNIDHGLGTSLISLIKKQKKKTVDHLFYEQSETTTRVDHGG